MHGSAPHEIDYAPPRSRPAWLGRAATIVIVAVAAAIASWIVLPRAFLRAKQLRAQEAILENRATLPLGALVSDLTWIGSRPGTMMFDDEVPALGTFTQGTLKQRWMRAAFVGGRSAGEKQRIVLVDANPVIYGSSRPPEISLLVWVFEPGGWTRSPALVHQSALGPMPLPVPPDGGWRLAVLPGQADAEDSSRFTIELEAGYDESADECRLKIVGFLMPDGSVRFDWPTESAPTEEAKRAQARAATRLREPDSD